MKFKEIFTLNEAVTFSAGEPGEKEVYLMVPEYGSVLISPKSNESSITADLEDFKVKIDSSVKKLITKALKEIKKK